MMRRTIAPDTRGFSLIECLLAITVLGLSVAGVSQAISVSLNGIKDSERLVQATLLASSKVEILRADTFLYPGEESGNFEEPFEDYAYRETIEESEVEGLHDVTVTVIWEPTGHQLYELRTRLFDKPYTPLPTTGDETTDPTSRRRDRTDPRGLRGSRNLRTRGNL